MLDWTNKSDVISLTWYLQIIGHNFPPSIWTDNILQVINYLFSNKIGEFLCCILLFYHELPWFPNCFHTQIVKKLLYSLTNVITVTFYLLLYQLFKLFLVKCLGEVVRVPIKLSIHMWRWPFLNHFLLSVGLGVSNNDDLIDILKGVNMLETHFNGLVFPATWKIDLFQRTK